MLERGRGPDRHRRRIHTTRCRRRCPRTSRSARIEPAIEHAVERGALVSIDTTSPAVAERALALGARIVNDVSCLADPELARVAARSRGHPDPDAQPRADERAAGFSEVPGRRLLRRRARRPPRVERRARSCRSGRHGREQTSGSTRARLREERATVLELLAAPRRARGARASRSSSVRAASRSSRGRRCAAGASGLGGTDSGVPAVSLTARRVLRVHDVRAVRQALAVRALRAPPEEAAHAG